MAAILHKVRRGETVMSICLTYGLSYSKFMSLQERFLFADWLELQAEHLAPGDQVVIGDSADPIDLLRVIERRYT